MGMRLRVAVRAPEEVRLALTVFAAGGAGGKVSRRRGREARMGQTTCFINRPHMAAMKGANRLEKLLDSVRARLRPAPGDQRRLKAVEDEVARRLRAVLPPEVEIGLMGSVAKGTALRHNNEIDVFLLIPRHFDHERMTTQGLAWAKKAMRGLPTAVNYAQHPYLQAKVNGIKVDIVPSYKIENIEKRGSAVDRSQLHTQWVNRRLSDAQRDDVRLLKQFLKSLGAYGAQSRVEGFSGYLCELLVIHHGSFAGVLEAASRWHRPSIDPAGHHEATEGVATAHPAHPQKPCAGVPHPGGARAKFPDAAMVVIDPVDAERNVAAVVSHTSRSRFTIAARAFLKKPSASFFFGKKEVHSTARLRAMMGSRDTTTLLLTMPSPPMVEDIVWPQLRKCAHALQAVLEHAEFRLFGHYFWADGKRAVILFEVMEERLPAVVRRIGPPAGAQKGVEAFLLRHRHALNLHVEHERVVAIEKREARTPKEALERALRQPSRLGIPKPFVAALRKRRWGTAMDLLREQKLREVASDYFSRKL